MLSVTLTAVIGEHNFGKVCEKSKFPPPTRTSYTMTALGICDLISCHLYEENSSTRCKSWSKWFNSSNIQLFCMAGENPTVVSENRLIWPEAHVEQFPRCSFGINRTSYALRWVFFIFNHIQIFWLA